MLQRGRPPTRGGDERWAAHRARRLQGTRLGGALSCTEFTRRDPDMSSTAYEYAPSANCSVDRRSASSQRRVGQQDAYRVFPRDPHALGVGTAKLRGRPHRVLCTHVELDRAAAWTRMSVRLTLDRQPRGRRRDGREWAEGWGAGATLTNTVCE